MYGGDVPTPNIDSLAAGGATDGPAVAAKLQEVSGGTGGGEKCSTFADCADIILSGGTADYDGISGPINCDEHGQCGAFNFAVYQFTDSDPSTFKAGENPKKIYPVN